MWRYYYNLKNLTWKRGCSSVKKKKNGKWNYTGTYHACLFRHSEGRMLLGLRTKTFILRGRCMDKVEMDVWGWVGQMSENGTSFLTLLVFTSSWKSSHIQVLKDFPCSMYTQEMLVPNGMSIITWDVSFSL